MKYSSWQVRHETQEIPRDSSETLWIKQQTLWATRRSQIEHDCLLDLPQVELMNFRVEQLSQRSELRVFRARSGVVKVTSSRANNESHESWIGGSWIIKTNDFSESRSTSLRAVRPSIAETELHAQRVRYQILKSLGRDEAPHQTCHELFFTINFITGKYKSLCYPMIPYIYCIWSFPQSRSLVSSPLCPCQICRRTRERNCWTFLCWQKRRWNSTLRASAPLLKPWQGRALVLNKYKVTINHSVEYKRTYQLRTQCLSSSRSMEGKTSGWTPQFLYPR